MPRAKRVKVKSVEEKKEAGKTLFLTDPLQHRHEDGTVHSHEGGDLDPNLKEGLLSKEEYCKEYGIERPGSNHAQTEYDKYIVSLA